MTKSASPHRVRVLFDPVCPWAYRASLWIREVTKVRPLKVEWRILSLEYVNRDKKDDVHLALLRRNRRTLRLLERARQMAGEETFVDLFLRIGEARHEQRRSLTDKKMLETALEKTGMPLRLLSETQNDPKLDAELEASYADAVFQGAIGVPTLYVDGGQTPFYGPIIDTVPTGKEAVALWEHVRALIQLPCFYELKRNRD